MNKRNKTCDIRDDESRSVLIFGHRERSTGVLLSLSQGPGDAADCLERVARKEIYKAGVKFRHLGGNRNRNCVFLWLLVDKDRFEKYHKRQMVQGEVENCLTQGDVERMKKGKAGGAVH